MRSRESSAREYFLRQPETIFGLATAFGGPVAILRVSGAKTKVIYSALTGSASFSAGIAYEAICDGNGVAFDRPLLLKFEGPKSFTGEDVLEIQFHGIRSVYDGLHRELLRLGAQPALPGEFLFRSVTHGKMTLVEAEALNSAFGADGLSDGASRGLLGLGPNQKQMSEVLDRICSELTLVRARIEASVDFSEFTEDQSRDLESCESLLDELSSNIGSMISGYETMRGRFFLPTVVIVGPPNAGKSTLFNILLGTDKALVSNQPGTTRDFIEAELRVADGRRVRIIDTAGWREAESFVEGMGIERGMSLALEASILLFLRQSEKQLAKPTVLDSRQQRLLEEFRRRGSLLVYESFSSEPIANCFDLSRPELFHEIRKNVFDAIGKVIDRARPVGDEERVLISSERQRALLDEAARGIKDALSAVRGSRPIELAGEDIARAEVALRAIQGRGVGEEYIGQIFSTFCLGK